MDLFQYKWDATLVFSLLALAFLAIVVVRQFFGQFFFPGVEYKLFFVLFFSGLLALVLNLNHFNKKLDETKIVEWVRRIFPILVALFFGYLLVGLFVTELRQHFLTVYFLALVVFFGILSILAKP